MSIDYQAELKKLEEFSGDYWKPKAGQHRVKALGEIVDSEPFIEDKEGALPQPRAQLKISVGGKDFSWNFPKGKTPASTYGQLIHLGAVKGQLTNAEFTVVVIGEGQSIRFTIVA